MADELSISGVLAVSGPQAGIAHVAGPSGHAGQGSVATLAENVIAAEGQAHAAAPASSDISFSVDRTSGQIVFQVRDASTGEMIRQVPSEEQVALEARMRQLLGTLLDQAM